MHRPFAVEDVYLHRKVTDIHGARGALCTVRAVDPERRARALSPLQHIEKSKTPVRFMQGKDDERCPKCQSEEMFVSLMRAGDTHAELVLYPGEDHGFLGEGAPLCREHAARRIADWVTRWCGARNAG